MNRSYITFNYIILIIIKTIMKIRANGGLLEPYKDSHMLPLS
jgi:hypothetical protein